MKENNIYRKKRSSAMKNLKLYIVFNALFVIFNIVVIYLKDGYSFPRNFFAIWPIIGWGIPTLSKLMELRRYKQL